MVSTDASAELLDEQCIFIDLPLWRASVPQKWKRIVLRKMVGWTWAALGALLKEAKASCSKIRGKLM